MARDLINNQIFADVIVPRKNLNQTHVRLKKYKIPPKLIVLTLILLRKSLSGAVRFHFPRTRRGRLAAVIVGLSAEPSQLVTIG